MRRARTHRCAVTIALLWSASIARATDAPDYAPPADGKLTDKQVSAYVAVVKEQSDARRAMAKAVDAATSDAAKLAAVQDMAGKVQAAVGHQGLSAGEYEWVRTQLDAALPAAMARQPLERQVQANQAAVATAEADAAKAAKGTDAGATADAKAAVDGAKRQLAAAQAALSAGTAVPDGDPKPDADNVALAGKHLNDFLAAISGSEPASAK